MQRLKAFLDGGYKDGKYDRGLRARDNQHATILSQEGGRWALPWNKDLLDETWDCSCHKQLFQLMAAAAREDFHHTLTYTLTQRMRYWVDLDFLVTAHTPSHASSIVNLEAALQLVQASVRAIAPEGSDCTLLALTIDKPKQKGAGFKVGVHIHGPFLDLSVEDLCAIREHAVTNGNWDSVVSESALLNRIEDVMDAAPYSNGGEAGGLRLPFCRKRDENERRGYIYRGGGDTVYRPRQQLSDAGDSFDISKMTVVDTLILTMIQIPGSPPLAPRRSGGRRGSLDDAGNDLMTNVLRSIYPPLAYSAVKGVKVFDNKTTVDLRGSACPIKEGGQHSNPRNSSVFVNFYDDGTAVARCLNANCRGESSRVVQAPPELMRQLGRAKAAEFEDPLSLLSDEHVSWLVAEAEQKPKE